jgi:hypothetical protein
VCVQPTLKLEGLNNAEPDRNPCWQEFVADAVRKDPDDRSLAEENAPHVSTSNRRHIYCAQLDPGPRRRFALARSQFPAQKVIFDNSEILQKIHQWFNSVVDIEALETTPIPRVRMPLVQDRTGCEGRAPAGFSAGLKMES